MLHGTHVVLRARHEPDVETLQTELYDDVTVRSAGDARPWRPIPPDSGASPFAPQAPSEDAAVFSAVVRDTGELIGEALLWGIDLHNRSANIGLALRPSFRGLGHGSDIVAVLCAYGFDILGLHRLQIETLTTNPAMTRVAAKLGFTREGVRRHARWVNGDFVDEVVFGLLREEWRHLHETLTP